MDGVIVDSTTMHIRGVERRICNGAACTSGLPEHECSGGTMINWYAIYFRKEMLSRMTLICEHGLS